MKMTDVVLHAILFKSRYEGFDLGAIVEVQAKN